MPRPPLPIGSWGKISTKVTKTDAKGKAIGHMAKANFRDHDGQVRDVRAAGRRCVSRGVRSPEGWRSRRLVRPLAPPTALDAGHGA